MKVLTTLSLVLMIALMNIAKADSSPEVWMIEAGVAEKNNDYRKALMLYQKAYLVKEMEDKAVLGIARVFMHENELEAARMTLTTHLSMKNPFNPEARLTLAETLHKMGRYDEALAEVRIVDELRPGWHPAKFRKGLVLFDQKNFAGAVDYFSFILREDPLHYEARINRGKAYIAKEQLDAALTDAKQAVEQRPHAVDGRVLLGTAYYFKGSYKEADEALRTALQSNPDMLEINDRLGDVQMKLGKNVSAVDFYKHCIEIDSHRLDIGLKLAKLYLKLGKYRDAEEELKRELALFPGYDPAAYTLVSLYLEEKRGDLVGLTLSGYTERFPDKIWSASTYEKLLVSIGELDRAEEFARRNLKASGFAVEPYLFYAYVRQKKGDPRGALKIMHEAESVYPTDARVKFNKGLLYELLGDTKEAMAIYQDVTDNANVTYKARVNLALMLEKMGKTEEAAEVLKTAVEPKENRKIAQADGSSQTGIALKPFREMELP